MLTTITNETISPNVTNTPGANHMLSNFIFTENFESPTESELERLYEKLLKIEVLIYRGRLKHLKSLRKRMNQLHQQIDNAYDEASKYYELDMHKLAITIREFQEDIYNLRECPPVRPSSYRLPNKNDEEEI